MACTSPQRSATAVSGSDGFAFAVGLPDIHRRLMAVVVWKYRRFIWANALADLRHRFSGSVAGYLWNVFVPLAQLLVFAVIFGALMGNRIDNEGPRGRFSFIVFLCSGLLAWNSFADTLTRAASSMVANAGYLKKLPLPAQIFVAQEAIGGLLTATISISLFILFSIFVVHYGPAWQWIQAAPLLVLFLGFAYGLGLMLACFNVFFRDVQPFMNVVVLLWMWLTPVVYRESLFVNPSNHHPIVLAILHLNPAYYFVTGFQQSLWLGQWIPLHAWIICIAIPVLFNVMGMLVLRRLHNDIRDVL